jgi:hypothetical protein
VDSVGDFGEEAIKLCPYSTFLAEFGDELFSEPSKESIIDYQLGLQQILNAR